jgi:hypothetical protein
MTVNRLKDLFKRTLRILFCGLYLSAIMLCPIIGLFLYIKFNLMIANIILFAISCLLIELYGKYYFKFNKDNYKNLNLKIHHYVEKNDIWIESNDNIDSIIDIEIVKHVKLNE